MLLEDQGDDRQADKIQFIPPANVLDLRREGSKRCDASVEVEAGACRPVPSRGAGYVAIDPVGLEVAGGPSFVLVRLRPTFVNPVRPAARPGRRGTTKILNTRMEGRRSAEGEGVGRSCRLRWRTYDRSPRPGRPRAVALVSTCARHACRCRSCQSCGLVRDNPRRRAPAAGEAAPKRRRSVGALAHLGHVGSR